MIQRRSVLAMMVGLALLAGAPAHSQEDLEQVSLSLAETLQMALENNLDLVGARKDPEIAEEGVRIQKAAFDPVLGAGGSYFESISEVFNPSELNESKSLSGNATVSQQLSFGGDYTAQWSASRFDASGPLFSIESAYSSALDLTFNLPLLQGFGKEATQEQLILASGNLEISRQELRRQAHVVLELTEGAYWDVIAAREALRVARESLERAQDLLDLNRKKVEVGTLAPIEITQAEAGVASQEENLILAETALDNAEDELRRLLAIPPEDAMWSKQIMPTDRPDMEERSVDLETAIEKAFEARPEMANARRNVRDRELSERVAKRAIRPQLNLRANLNPSGNNFSQDPGPDGILNTFDDQSVVSGRFAEAIEEIPEFENWDTNLSLNYSIPIGNRAAKAGYRTATLNRQKSEIALRNLEQNIRVEVRSAVRAVESGFKRVEAARANVELQKKKLDAERKKFENGMSTSFQVLEFQNDLSEAELSLIRAALDYVKSLTAVERAQGTLLEARNLRLE